MNARTALVALVCLGVLVGSASSSLAASMPREATTAQQLAGAVLTLGHDPASLADFADTLKTQTSGLTPAQAAVLAASGPVVTHATLTAQVDAILTDASLTPQERAYRLADVATHAQAADLGVSLPPVVVVPHATPSAAILALADSTGSTLTPDEVAQAHALDAETSAPALARVIDAFSTMNQAAARAFSASPDHPAWGETLSARLALLDAITGLEPFAVPTLPNAPHAAPPTYSFPGLLAVDMGGNTLYRSTDQYALTIDLGGDDEYDNNAGGNTFGDCGMMTQAAGAIDLGGTDKYAPTWDHGTPGHPIIYADSCGKNGGSVRGAGFLFHEGGDGNQYGAGQREGINGGAEGPAALGFLLSAGTNDQFNAGYSGTNGGAVNNGVGALIEAGTGFATFYAGNQGTNGGAYAGDALSGNAPSLGLLIDSTGGYHQAQGYGSNGGGEGKGALGFAYGSGTWDDGSNGANGGGDNGGTGSIAGASLWVSAGSYGTNGGAEGTGSVGSISGVVYANGGDFGVNGGAADGGHATTLANGCACYAGSYGVNGGAYNTGTVFFLDALGGNYQAGSNGANGGADQTGVAMFLVAGNGGSGYYATNDGTNGGASNSGLAFFIDAGTNGAMHQAGSQGVNGGAYSFGHALFIDAGGSDTYNGADQGVNGGVMGSGAALLVDLTGNDAYTCSSPACNGAVVGSGGVGLLLDVEGADCYNGNCAWTPATVAGIGGARIDLSPV